MTTRLSWSDGAGLAECHDTPRSRRWSYWVPSATRLAPITHRTHVGVARAATSASLPDHVGADAHHEVVALHDLAVSFVGQEPHLASDVLFGARALMEVEGRFAAHLLSAWQAGRSSLLDDPVLASTA